jgi:mRNA deadenylase 3'-5' endonuclease subunit Ccr4
LDIFSRNFQEIKAETTLILPLSNSDTSISERFLIPACGQDLSCFLSSTNAARFLSVVQYNILANQLAVPKHFPYAADDALQWIYRRERIVSCAINPLLPFMPDIIALEELSDYWTYFQEIFSSCSTSKDCPIVNYSSVFCARPSIHQTSWSNLLKRDGCGIFFNKKRFELIAVQELAYPDEHDRCALMIMLRDKNISTLDSQQYLFVICTHLYWDSTRVDIQLSELRTLEKHFISWRTEMCTEKNAKLADTPIILCGDMNNTPQSLVYEYITKRFMSSCECPLNFRSAFESYKCHEKAFFEKKKSLELTKASGCCMSTSQSKNDSSNSCTTVSSFSSLADSVSSNSLEMSVNPVIVMDPSKCIHQHKKTVDEPDYTSVSHRRQHTIDYIFYSCAQSANHASISDELFHLLSKLDSVVGIDSKTDSAISECKFDSSNVINTSNSNLLSVVGVSNIPDINTLTRERNSQYSSIAPSGIPNSVHGSDHISIGAVFLYETRT